MIPTLLGFIGIIPFLLSIACTVLVFYLLFRKFLKYKLDPQHLKKNFFAPIIGIQMIYVMFYILGWIPPVPLSAKYMGIYHDVKKIGSEYHLYFNRPKWKFWQNGDQDFKARPGDKIYLFASIYSPARFSDQVNVRWVYKDSTLGWVTWDKIPIQISGGREEGFRGYAFKSNFKEGDWKIQLETTDEREIGRIYLTIESDASTDEREFRTDIL
jgi:hypothetical protein